MLEYINENIISLLTPWLLFAAGIFFAFKLKFFFLRHPVRMLRAMTERKKSGGTSPFRAVMLALAGTLGVGNIAGVASSIAIGGYGSVFWMWVSALVAMVLKYAEIVLAIRHRRYDCSTGEYRGGAAYYIKDHFSSRGLRTFGCVLAILFSLLCVINSVTMGCVIQSNAISTSLEGVLNIPTWVTGAIVASLVGFAILGNGQRIGALSEKIVPLVTLLYILISVAAMAVARDRIDDAFALIFRDAFHADSAVGGIFGFLLSRGLKAGTMRGLMSNEAGCGTAPTAHAAADTDSAARQGLWGLFEVFVDTILLCTLTAIVIILAGDGVLAHAADPMMMAIAAFSSLLGEWAQYFMCASVFLFAFATLICWAHYGRESLTFISRKKPLQIGFVLLFTAFTFIGAVTLPEISWLAADLALGVMTIINIIMLFLMSHEVVEETKKLFRRRGDALDMSSEE